MACRRPLARPEPFVARAAPAVLADLRGRLRATRWPDAPGDAGWSLGADLAYLRELAGSWADGFGWPGRERALARLPRFGAGRGGAGIHFVHARAAGRAGPVLLLVLCHGWPDSFWRYVKVISLLTDPGAHGAGPAGACDVVVPGMPGYGYSGRPDRCWTASPSPGCGPGSWRCWATRGPARRAGTPAAA